MAITGPVRNKLRVTRLDETGQPVSSKIGNIKIDETKKELPIEIERPTPTLDTKQHPFAQRITLPSNGHLYEPDILIRPFSATDLAQLAKAKQFNSATILYDTVDATLIDRSVRELSSQDVRYVLYWQRLNSFTKRPFMFNPTTIYGNTLNLRLSNTTIKTKQLEDPEGKLAYFLKDSMFTYPTAADLEVIEDFPNKNNADIMFMISRAQYLKGSSFKEKCEKFQTLSADDLVDLVEFSKLLDYGTQEYIEIADSKFVYAKAIEYLENKIKNYNYMKMSDENIPENVLQIINLQEEICLDELDRLKKEGEGARAKTEKFNFSLDLADFFPDI